MVLSLTIKRQQTFHIQIACRLIGQTGDIGRLHIDLPRVVGARPNRQRRKASRILSQSTGIGQSTGHIDNGTSLNPTGLIIGQLLNLSKVRQLDRPAVCQETEKRLAVRRRFGQRSVIDDRTGTRKVSTRNRRPSTIGQLIG